MPTEFLNIKPEVAMTAALYSHTYEIPTHPTKRTVCTYRGAALEIPRSVAIGYNRRQLGMEGVARRVINESTDFRLEEVEVEEVPITSFEPANPRTFEQYEISACILDSILDPFISDESWVRLRDVNVALADLTDAELNNVVWTLYGFSQKGLTTAIADRGSLEAAHELYYQITGVDTLATLKASDETTFYLPAFPGQKLD